MKRWVGRLVLGVAAVWVGVLGVCFGGEEKWPTAGELLDEFAKTQEVFKSFTAKSEARRRYTLEPRSPQFSKAKQDYTELIDYRYDQEGKRVNKRTCKYGNVTPAFPEVPKEDPWYTSKLYIGDQFHIGYGRSNITSDVGRATLDIRGDADSELRTVKSLSRAFQGHEALGYFYGDDKRVDEMLRNAKEISLRKEMESVGDYKCFVIEATTDRGRYSVWLDPKHGFNIAKAKVLRKEGDTAFGEQRTLKEGEKYYVFVDKVKLEQIDGTWVPVEAEVVYDWEVPGKYDYREITHVKVKKYDLNPDHDALRSFVPDDIQNGARFTLIDDAGISPIKYTWRDGKVVDGEGEEVEMRSKGKSKN